MIELSYKLVGSGIATLLVGSLTYITLQIYFLRQKYKHIPGPPATGLTGFYLGNLIELRNKKGLMSDKFLEWLISYY